MVGDSRLALARPLLDICSVDVAENWTKKMENRVSTDSHQIRDLDSESETARDSSCYSIFHDHGDNFEPADNQSGIMGIDYGTDYGSFHAWTCDDCIRYFYPV